MTNDETDNFSTSPQDRQDHLDKFTVAVQAVCGVTNENASPSAIREVAFISETLWCYYQIDEDHRAVYTGRLARIFDMDDSSGPGQLDEFLSEMALVFESISAEPFAFDGESAVKRLDQLITSGRPEEAEDDADGEFESLAEFAEPLICCDKVQDNPDLIDEMMMRANDYWNLALSANGSFDSRLDVLISKYAQNGETPADIRNEAVMMIERFNALYRR